MADCTDNVWGSCFQETGEKVSDLLSHVTSLPLCQVLGVKAEELGRLMESDEDQYSQVFTAATFKTYQFRSAGGWAAGF